ncbi:MAG: 1-deoxy-D-xylulose-5-phosphate synthase [Bacteroidales bacterium]|nr:1-deoxy-D-xylulose-5-phosphate synthase [Bacteroidales bacterium]
MLLNSVNSPADVKKLSVNELNILCSDIRECLIKRLSVNGGHCGPNLGMVEMTIALHYVFNSPTDKIVFDVSHQCYTHKILTGRKEAFINPQKYKSVSGYTEPSESEHDHFIIGHTSTSVSLASGMAKARDLNGEKYNVIAIIGDGSLSGGEAFEGLDYAAELNSNMIVIVNDNQMSIAENHGGIYKNLALLRETNGSAECNLFKAMGFDYMYIANGNDIEVLINAFNEIKDCNHPIVVHINTIKGKGYKPAEDNKESWHFCSPFDIESGKPQQSGGKSIDYQTLTADYLLDRMKTDKSIVAITAGTPTVMGFDAKRREKAGDQFVDVGIAEEHAVALASGLAKGGAKPVFGVYSTFIQRAYDQISQDLCINNNPATLLVFWGSLGSMNDVTHLCFFDIPLLSNIPNLVYLAPTCIDEYWAMLNWSINQTEYPVAIRVPARKEATKVVNIEKCYSPINRYKVIDEGSDVAIIAAGSYFSLGERVASLLSSKYGITPTLINPRYLTGIDKCVLNSLKENHKVIATLEDGVLDGGFGEKISRFFAPSNMKVLNFGAKKEFVDRYNIKEFLKVNHLTDELIVEDIINCLKK